MTMKYKNQKKGRNVSNSIFEIVQCDLDCSMYSS